MPNLKPPVTCVSQALAYRERIMQSVPQGIFFRPLMTLYRLTLPADELNRLADEPDVAAKVLSRRRYHQLRQWRNFDRKGHARLEKMTDLEIPLLVHGEVTTHEVDILTGKNASLIRF